MFKTADGEMLDLAPWRMRRLLRLLADTRRYPAGTPPQMLVNDLRQIVARARRVSTQPRLGTARFESAGACCRACLLARLQQGVLSLVGLSLVPALSGDLPEDLPARLSARLPADLSADLSGHLSERYLPKGYADEAEYKMPKRSVNRTLAWRRWPSLINAAVSAQQALPRSGVYLLERNGVPVYVGKSRDLRGRMLDHRLHERLHRDTGLAVWAAEVPPADLDAVEHALTRLLSYWAPRTTGRRSMLVNTQRTGSVSVGAGGVDIRCVLPVAMSALAPPGNHMSHPADSAFELAP
ncbi:MULTISPECIES: GIY-YIG nuclease family protein [unclassified Cupriavidus]|uniref:GIY-YIG nuclease family protein n=1 Tax=unclassified Cupriavidus TaxID=2640874 RepID=UPI003F8E2F66